MERKWYVAIEDKQHGPLTLLAVQNLYKNGKINEKTPIWCQGMVNWAPLNNILELKKLIDLPEMSSTQEVLENNGMKEKTKSVHQLVENKLKGQLNKAYNENIDINENIIVKLNGYSGYGLVVTDQRVVIITGGIATGEIGAIQKCKSLYLSDITSISFRNASFAPGTGELELLVPGSNGDIGRGVAKLENVVKFNKEQNVLFKKASDIIRELSNKDKTIQVENGNEIRDTDIPTKIRELAELKNAGILTETEFQIKKVSI